MRVGIIGNICTVSHFDKLCIGNIGFPLDLGGFIYKSLQTHSKTNICNPMASEVCKCTNITNNTDTPEVFGPGVALSPETL